MRRPAMLCVLVLAWAVIGEGVGWPAGAASPPAAEVRLLKWPYPYQAALTVNSDIDGATVEKFEAVHTLINTRGWNEAGRQYVRDHFCPQAEALRIGPIYRRALDQER